MCVSYNIQYCCGCPRNIYVIKLNCLLFGYGRTGTAKTPLNISQNTNRFTQISGHRIGLIFGERKVAASLIEVVFTISSAELLIFRSKMISEACTVQFES